jgi:hypothetical protein
MPFVCPFSQNLTSPPRDLCVEASYTNVGNCVSFWCLGIELYWSLDQRNVIGFSAWRQVDVFRLWRHYREDLGPCEVHSNNSVLWLIDALTLFACPSGNTHQREYKQRSAITSAALHPNQAEIICGCQDGSVRIIDLVAGKVSKAPVRSNYAMIGPRVVITLEFPLCFKCRQSRMSLLFVALQLVPTESSPQHVTAMVIAMCGPCPMQVPPTCPFFTKSRLINHTYYGAPLALTLSTFTVCLLFPRICNRLSFLFSA